MELTKEQNSIIHSTGNIKINAVAGSGKTTTVIEYAKSRPSASQILYLAFNKSVKLEAVKKFASKGLNNVQVETAHSLAYKHIVFSGNYTVRHQGYKTSEIAELLHLDSNGEKHSEYVIANHINKFIAFFCNSDKLKTHNLKYLETITDPEAKRFVSTYYKYIVRQSRVLLGKMDRGEIEITHDFYLKKFQLSNPQLHYDYILFDEGQDASLAMLDVFLKQKATKVIVGDTHQQIYGWRYAVNSLEKVDFKTYYLSTSFRFGQGIANLAIEELNLKRYIGQDNLISILGKGVNREIKTKATLARTNLGLLLNAIEYITENENTKGLYFEGNINSYTYAGEGASLYDVLHLRNGKPYRIKDKLIREMKNMDELEDYTKKTEDAQLAMMVEIVKEYGNEIPELIKSLKEKHVPNDEKEKAEMVFSTVHRCKGMEYDEVYLVNDFINKEKLEKLTKDKKEAQIIATKLNEEINLLYVAVTRTMQSLHIPKELLPEDFPPSDQIHVLKDSGEEEDTAKTIALNLNINSRKDDNKATKKAYSVDEVRARHSDAYMPWNEKIDDELTVMYCEKATTKEMATHFGRTQGAIRSRIKKLELRELYG